MADTKTTTTVDLPHLQFSRYKGRLQLEFHVDPNKNPDLANRFTRKTVGSSMGKTIAKAIQANGAATVIRAIGLVAAEALGGDEGAAVLDEVAKLVGASKGKDADKAAALADAA
jgi:hypothetical protein